MLYQFGHDTVEAMLQKILRFEMRTLNARFSSLPDLRDFASKIEVKKCHRIYHDPLILECVMEIRHFTLELVSHPFFVFWDWIWIRQHRQLPFRLCLGKPNRASQYMPSKLRGPTFRPRNDHFGVPFGKHHLSIHGNRKLKWKNHKACRTNRHSNTQSVSPKWHCLPIFLWHNVNC